MEEAEDGVAVVGIGCNFPGGEGLENFWKVLENGKNCSVPIPRERFDTGSWYDPDDTKAGKSRTAKAAFIDGFNEFDHRFFGISESEVEQMDPQQKQLLQCVYRALENAGIPMEKASGTRTGVFFGIMNRDYETNAAHVHPSVINHWTGTGLAMSIAANRVSYVFNLTGPSLSLDCACSSSLVALHLACQSIKQGDCDMAFCGGVNCIIEPRVFVALSKAKMISPEGTSKPFSTQADGYGRGEGCGVVLLKPLKRALQDLDHIWGVITKTAINQDGRSVVPMTKPSVKQQEELLRRIYSKQDTAAVQFIEAHGTGTPIGDPTEAESISNVITKARHPSSQVLWVGSVKSNIGHTESTAGMAGLIKVLLMMKHKTIVPSVFYSEETSSVDVKALNIKIPQKVEKWECSGARVAGVNNFGFGGTNAHAIVKQYLQPHAQQKSNEIPAKYFVMSAMSQKSLTMMVEDTLKHLEEDRKIDLDSLLFTSACRRSHQRHRYRKVLLVSSVNHLMEKLRGTAAKNIRPAISDPRLVFVFCGNGLTYPGMCRQLLKTQPVFRDRIAQISHLFKVLSPLNILETLESDSEVSDSKGPDVVQPLLFAIQVGITSLLRHWGVKPDAMLGHSVGEVAAAHCSGLLSLEDAVRVIYFRSILQSKVIGGKMLVVSNMAVSKVESFLPPYSGKVCLAAFNSSQSCTLSGDADAIETLRENLRNTENSENLFLRMLDVPVAYHSQRMDPILPEIQAMIGTLAEHDLQTELFSTVTGREVQQGDFCTGRYWARNIREPVAFEQAVRSATKDKKGTIFVEIGPRRALQRNIMETLGNNTEVLASVEPQKDHQSVLSTVSKLFELGFQVDWDEFYKGNEATPTPFPKYQFDCSDRDVIIGAAQNTKGSSHPVLCQRGSECNIFSCDLMSESTAYLKQHKHNNISIVPGAFYAELGLAAFLASANPKVPLSSLQLSVNFHSPFILTQNSPEMKVKVVKTEEETSFTVYSPSALYASGTVVSKADEVIDEQRISLSSIYKRCTSVVNFREFYWYLSQGGFQYGEVFQNKAEVRYGEDLKEALATVSIPKKLKSHLHDYCIHPVVLDYLMQLLPVTVEHIFAGRPGFPAQIGSLRVFEPLKNEMIIYLRATDVGSDHFEVCGCFADKEGRVLVEVKHVMVKYIVGRNHVVKEYFYHNTYTVALEKVTTTPPPKALVFSDHLGISEGLQKHLDQESRYVPVTHAKDILTNGFSSLLANLKITSIEKNFDEVLFLWGKEDLTSQKADTILQNLASCCEVFRQIVLKLKQIQFLKSIRAITYRSSDITVDHVSPGFAIAGMTRSFAAEIPDLSVQLIDVCSVSSEDTVALFEILRSYPCSKYPELVVKDGQIFKPSIVRTQLEVTDKTEARYDASTSDFCIFHTADAHKMTHLTAMHFVKEDHPLDETSVEIHPSKVCAHTSDYFPVSSAHLTFGQTLYWNKHSSQKHKLLALDFCGTVTAVGKDVKKLKVGDHVASCCPVVAASRVTVPEVLCYNTRRFPFLQKTPCVSYFWLAWEILHRVLPKAKQNLGIVCSVPDSSFFKVLVLAACKSGWNVTQCNRSFADVSHVEAFIVLPPFDESLTAKVLNLPGIRHAVIVCNTHMQGSLVQDRLQSVQDSVDVQTVQMKDVLQKGHLRAHKSQFHKWLKSLNLSRKYSIENFTFQKSDGSTSDNQSSYFSAQTLPVVALDKDSTMSDIPLVPAKRQMFRRRAVYIVAGGLSGLGFETVKFISQRGGKHIVILSRSIPTPDVQQEINNVEKQCGNRIKSLECDISIFEHVHESLTTIGQVFPDCPVRGVFHSAVVLHDGLIESLDRSLYEKVLKPKVSGVLNLHHATQQCQLEYFVCYSSISAFLGNASQTNYAAANSFLDMFCQYRRRIGLPGQSINWGALNLGLLLNKEHFQRFLEAKGMMVLDVAEIHKSLEQCLLLNQAQQAVCRFHFSNIRYNILSQNKALTMRLSALVEEAFKKSREVDPQLRETKAVSPKEYVLSLLCETVGVDLTELREESLLSSLGIDSMQAMTLQNLIFQERGVNVPLVNLLDPSATLSTVIALLRNESEEGNLGSVLNKDVDDVLTRL
uniref:Fatty acid synthase 2 n=1 Tax=Oryzias sinensis TaxID=183150 RepID=A0A8C7YTJ6_9TELE